MKNVRNVILMLGGGGIREVTGEIMHESKVHVL
jgi:hypothetical protein